VFVAAITIIPVFAVTPKIKARVEGNRFNRLMEHPEDNSDSSLIGIASFVFFIFAIVFLILSISYSDRFIIGQDDPMALIFAGMAPDIAELSGANALLASWIAGLLPLFTTTISFVVYFLVWTKKGKELIANEITSCKRKINGISNDNIKLKIQLTILDNFSTQINGISTSIEGYKTSVDAYKTRAKEEHYRSKDIANAEVARQLRIDLNKFIERGTIKFKDIRKHKGEGSRRFLNWEIYYKGLQEKINTEVGS